MNENELAKIVFSLGLKVHEKLGPGLLESTYQECLLYEIKKAGISAEKQFPVPLIYDDVNLETGYRIDILVEKKLIIELKSVESLNEKHFAQILTYLRLSDCKLELLMNFNTILFKDGVKRVINGTI